MKKMALLFFCCVICNVVGWGHEYTDEQVAIFLDELRYAQVAVSDEESKRFIQSILDDGSQAFDDDEKVKHALSLLNRIYLVRDLESILASGEIKDAAARTKIEDWLDDQITLDNAEEQKLASEIIDEVRKRLQIRFKLYLQLQSLLPQIGNQEDRKKVQTWLNDITLFDDPKIQAEAEQILSNVSHGGFSKRHGMSRMIKVMRALGVLAYAGYRKFRCMKYFEKVKCVEAEGYFDWLAAFAYLTTTELEENDGLPFEEIINNLRSKGIDSLGNKFKFIVEDSLSRYVLRKRVKELNTPEFKEKMDDLIKEIDEYNKNIKTEKGFWRKFFDWLINKEPGIAYLKQQKENLEKNHKAAMAKIDCRIKIKEIEGQVNEKVKKRMQQEGCPRKALDFFAAFDSDIIKIWNQLLEKVGVPKNVMYFMRSRPVRIAEQIAALKILPAYLFWRKKYGQEEPFVNSSFGGEISKSAAELVRLRAVESIILTLNGALDKNGRGSLDHLRNKTCGLLGPNLILSLSNLITPRANIAVSNKISELVGGNGKLVTEASYFKKGEEDWRVQVPKEAMSYVGRNFVFYSLSKLFGKCRSVIINPLENYIGCKVCNFCEFLVRRGWINKELWNDLKAVVQELPVSAIKLFDMVGSLSIMAIILWQEGAISPRDATVFDISEAFLAVKESGDIGRALDFLVAFLIGRWAGNKFAEFGVEKIKDVPYVFNLLGNPDFD